MKLKLRTYEIKYNDFGIVYVIASSFSEAEKKFIEAGYGSLGEELIDVSIKSIIRLNDMEEPLYPD
jgi:hypothetical protein